MRLVQLEYLLALKKYGFISTAAEHLFVSQPTISVAIKDLEEELGYPLIIRSNRGITFTEQGQRVLDQARQIFDLVENIRQKDYDSAEMLSGEVQLACTPPFCKAFALDVFMEVKKNYPGIDIHLIGSDSDVTMQMVHDGTFQIGIVHLDDVDQYKLRAQVDRKQLQYGELCREEINLTVREGHPLLQKEDLCLDDLLEFPYVTPDATITPKLHDMYLNSGSTANIYYVSDVCTVRTLQYQQDALAMTPRRAFLQGNQIFRRDVVALDIPELNHTCSVIWITRPTIQPSVKKVLELLITRCSQLDSLYGPAN